MKEESEHTVSTFNTRANSISAKSISPTKGRIHTFLKDSDVERCKSLIETEEVARIIGVVTHFAYWQVFGHLNPVHPDQNTKKQMILISVELINVLRKKITVCLL